MKEQITSFNNIAKRPWFSLRAAAMEACAMFPQESKHIVFGDVGSGRIVHPKKLLPIDHADMQDIQKTVKTARKFDESFVREMFIPGMTRRYLFVDARSGGKSFLGDNSLPAHEFFFRFDHELAHAVIKDAGAWDAKSPHAAEAIADTFAILRHYQRFGIESTAMDKLPLSRAVNAFFLPEVVPLMHFTSPVIEHVIDTKLAHFLEVLSPRETADLAVELAFMYLPSYVTFCDWNDSCAAITADFRKHDPQDDAAYRGFAKNVLSNDIPLGLRKWGHAVLSGMMQGNINAIRMWRDDKPENGIVSHQPPALSGPHWEKIKEELSTTSGWKHNLRQFSLRP